MNSFRLFRRMLDITVLLLILPLLGVQVAGTQPVAAYLEFPPLTRHVPHAAFSWPCFVCLAVFILMVVAPFVVQVARSGKGSQGNMGQRTGEGSRQGSGQGFPWWGWAGIAFTILAWVVAWTRLPFLSGVQSFTFTPLWLGYIVVVNAWTWQRTGRCLLIDRPLRVAALFAASAVFWWYFEYLNRFVQNWYYVGIDEMSQVEYFLYATLPFATVLPAVLSTDELLA